MFALLSASLAASEGFYTVPVASVLCADLQTETMSGFKSLTVNAIDDLSRLSRPILPTHVQGCKLSNHTELETCTLFKWKVGNETFVELQCSGGQSCALARYANATAESDIISNPEANQLQSIIVSDNSMLIHTTGGALSPLSHANTAGYSCGNTCAVRAKVTPHGENIYVTAKVGVITTVGGYSYTEHGTQFVELSSASSVSWGILSLIVLAFSLN